METVDSKTERKDKCCSKSEAVETAVLNEISDTVSSVFDVQGMDCADEVAAIKNALSGDQVARIQADLMRSRVTVEHAASLSREKIAEKINKAGVRVVENKMETRSFFVDNRKRVLLVSAAGAFLGIGLLTQWLLEVPSWILLSLNLISSVLGGALIVPKAIRALRQKSLDMNVLMTMAAVGAFVIGEYSEAASVVFLFSLAEMLEAFSVARARKAIREILSVAPQTAFIEVDGGLKEIPVDQIAVGQIVTVLAGENIPMDGEVVSGSSSVNQAPLTGESQPVSKTVGDSVLAGTINESGTLKIKVTHVFKESKIANVIRLVEETQNTKAPSQLFVDKFARVYTPVVTLVAVLVAVLPPLLAGADWSTWFYRALVFLVIACPCALVIATPVSIVSALTSLAKLGVLVKGGVFLESLGKLRAIAVDKTGTITEGAPKVVSVKLWGEASENELLSIAGSLESESTHPLAKAVSEYVKEQGLANQPVQDFKVIQGKGIQGKIGGHLYFAGNHKLAHEFGVCSKELEEYLNALELNARSVLVVGHMPHDGCSGEVLGILGVADEPRANVKTAIANLHRVGITEITMLSGDNQKTVSAIAKRVGIDRAVGDLLPEGKVEAIREMIKRNRFVGMIGDGINDAPALAQADVGIAMGAAGTDAAIETADIALMADDLNQLSKAIHHGRRTLSIVRFNIGFALATKAIFIVLGLFGLSNLWLAVAADMGASLFVIANSMRLLRVELIEMEASK